MRGRNGTPPSWQAAYDGWKHGPPRKPGCDHRDSLGSTVFAGTCLLCGKEVEPPRVTHRIESAIAVIAIAIILIAYLYFTANLPPVPVR